jgi:hypothetical protein
VIFRRGRFAAIVATQLDQFAGEHRDAIEECDERLAVYNAADRDEAEELYGDYVDAVETATELLADIRDNYARLLDEGVDEEYQREFNRAVEKRWKPLALEIENR